MVDQDLPTDMDVEIPGKRRSSGNTSKSWCERQIHGICRFPATKPDGGSPLTIFAASIISRKTPEIPPVPDAISLHAISGPEPQV